MSKIGQTHTCNKDSDDNIGQTHSCSESIKVVNKLDILCIFFFKPKLLNDVTNLLLISSYHLKMVSQKIREVTCLLMVEDYWFPLTSIRLPR